MNSRYDVAIIGGGFTGLAIAHDLTKAGKKVVVLEADPAVGGLAGSFEVGGESLEKFYHHWFTNDVHVMDMIRELGKEANILHRPTRTGMYYAKNFFKLSTPVDVLKFSVLPFPDRIRLGLLALKARKVENWQELEHKLASEWLIGMGGKTVYEKVWKPMLAGKFGPYADDISAVWFWNKLKLRGGSRGKGGEEVLAYYKGGFASLAEEIAKKIVAQGGEVRVSAPVFEIIIESGEARGVRVGDETIFADQVIATIPSPVFAKMLGDQADATYKQVLGRIDYLANVCLVLQLDRSLSETYWLNVADPDFPYVGIIEHTNFEPPETYAGRHIVYLSKYLPESEPLFKMSDEEALEFSIPHLKRMFPAFDRSWVQDFHVWRARYSQPIVVKEYSKLIPPQETPFRNLSLVTMSQVYPEDRGTNYAIREGRKFAQKMLVESPVPVPR